MSRALVCTPLLAEYLTMRGRLGSAPVTVERTGQGPARSLASARRLSTQSAGLDGVLVAGVCGSLQPHVKPGDLVIATEVRKPPEQPLPCPTAPLLAAALRRRGLRVHLGDVESRDSVVTGRSRAALARDGALAVDLESADLGASFPDTPFAVVRAVVDTPDHPLLRPGTVPRGIRALRGLRSAAPAIEEWAAALDRRQLILASPRSFCAGVARAIEIVERGLERFGAPVYVRRQIVHNTHVVRQLEDRGAIFVEEIDQVPPGSVVVLAAHGVSPVVRAAAEHRQLRIVDATCPLVTKVHSEVRRYAARGDTVFLIGHREHEEVVGTAGESPDNVLVIGDAREAATVQVRDPQRVSYVMQTTLAIDEATEISAVLRDRFPGLSGPRRDDICYATTNRQHAVREVADESDLVLVVGSATSSNSRRLVEVAERRGARARLVEDVTQVDLRWLAGVGRVGVTAGASAPPELVDELVECLSGLGPVTIHTTDVIEEDVLFTLPREVI